MKVCKMGLENIWIMNGNVQMCGWTGYQVGSLSEHTIEELWNSEKAEIFRQSMLDGSYRFCSCQKCPYLANNTRDQYMVDYKVPEYPKFCSLSYEQQCNYVCTCCRKEPYRIQEGEGEKIKKIESEVHKLISHLEHISANGVGELFCSGNSLKILSEIDTDNIKEVTLESNGSLFTPDNWKKIRNLEKYKLNVIITVHSFNEKTYQFLSGTDMSVDTVIENLHFIQSLRDQERINSFEIATVVCERNFREMPEFAEYCLKEFNPDSVRLRFYKNYGVDSLAIEWFYDIRNPYHPYYKEYVEVMKNPIFNHPKVWKWQGDQISNIGEHPYFIEHKKLELEHKKLDLIGRIMSITDMKRKWDEYLNIHSIKSFSLYGFSNICKCLIVLFDNLEIQVDKIYDSNVNLCFAGKCVVKPNEEELTSDAVIVTSLAYQEIYDILQCLGYKGKILDINCVLDELTCCNG